MASEVHFAGLLLSAQFDGNVLIRPDSARIFGLVNLRSPSTKEELLSLLGLLATLNRWVPNLSVTNAPLHNLSKKNVTFVWGPDQELAMQSIKTAVKEHVFLSPFDPSLESFIFTDASTVGPGYVLVQKTDVRKCQSCRENSKVKCDKCVIIQGEVQWTIISCVSCGLTSAQSRYSIYDLELSGLVFACMKLQDYMAGGLFFTIFCDHKALEGMEKRDLSSIVSIRTMRHFEVVLQNNVRVVHVKEQCNKVADFLSRNPRQGPVLSDIEKFVLPLPEQHIRILFEGEVQDPQLLELAVHGGLDLDYRSLLDVLQTGESIQHLGPNHPVRGFVKVFDRLSILDFPTGSLVILDGCRIVIPKEDRTGILALLHKYRFSATAMMARAKTCVFGPCSCQT